MSQITLAALHTDIAKLATSVTHSARGIRHGWAASESSEAALGNLAAYLALRQHDLSPLQASLAAYGLSTLGRCESHVLASLGALHASLSRLAGHTEPAYPGEAAMRQGFDAIARAQNSFFGPDTIDASTRIMVTLPSEAATDRDLVARLIEAGMGCARINCAHDGADAWRAMAALVREEAAKAGRECRVSMDIGGPKCRIETVHAIEEVRLVRGDRLAVVDRMAAAFASDNVIVTISFPEILAQLHVGAEVWINDGKIGTHVISAEGGRVVLEVHSARSKGERLRPEKGINFPDTDLEIDPITAQDLAGLDTVAEIADSLGFSFVQRPQDIRRLHAELARRRPGLPPLPVVLKIETPLAVRNLPLLIVQALLCGPTAVMIARGDLAVELGFARMSEIQEEIMWLCEAAHIPVVWATQVLDGMVRDGQPTRAETTDAAMSQRAECVMLNKGPFLVEAVRFLADVVHRMDRHQTKKLARLGPLHSWPSEELRLAGV